MKTITTVINLLLLPLLVQAQRVDIFPWLPFDRALATEKGYSKTSVQVAFYSKGETDESGYTWSIQRAEGYQCAKYSYFNGQMEFETRYKPDGDKLVSWQYHYRQGLLSAIDEFSFDSTQAPVLQYTYVYYYDAQSNPFQKVVQFQKERNFRLLYDYTFDAQRRPVRERITAAGKMEKWNTVASFLPGRTEQITLVEYRDDVQTLRVYENLHAIVETYILQYDLTTKLPQRLEFQDRSRQVVWMADLDYDAERRISKETHYHPTEDTERKPFRIVHYFYDGDGLLERRVEEEGTEQTIYSYFYFTE